MKRRAYLATAATVTFAGCMGSSSDDDGDGTGDDESQSDDTDGATGNPSEDSNGNGDDNENGDDDGGNGDSDSDEDGNEGDDHTGKKKEDLLGTFDDFEDLSNWTVLDGALEADEDRSYVGSQSAQLTAGMLDDRVSISYKFDEPADLTDVVPGVAMASEELIVPVIQVIDEDGERVHYRRGVKGGLALQRYNFGVTDVIDDPNLSRVSEIRILLWVDGFESRRFWIDDFHFLPRPDTGKVMIQFDDTHDTDYTEGLPILEEYGYSAVTFINPGRVGRDGSLDLEQLEALQEAGWTVGNHSMSHPDITSLSDEEQEAEIVDAKEWLVDNGFEHGAKYYAHPFGEYDETTLEILEEHHDLGFAGGFPAQGYAANPLLCTRIGDPDVDDAHEMLDRTAEMRGITSLFYHRLEDERLEDFKEVMAHLHDLESAGDLEIIMPEDIEDDLNVF